MRTLEKTFFILSKDIFCDKIFNQGKEENEVTWKRALKIGFFQCISVIPGVSRSMATIVGGMQQKLTRKKAAEFSFFLAVPTMAGATLLDVIEMFGEDTTWATSSNILILLIGCAVAFVVALLAMKWFVSFLTKYGFKTFGVYKNTKVNSQEIPDLLKNAFSFGVNKYFLLNKIHRFFLSSIILSYYYILFIFKESIDIICRYLTNISNL